MKKNMQEITNHLKATGFVFQGSEIYGGLANTWDYGPLGVLLMKNIKDLWWRKFVTLREDIYGLDSKILMNSKVWEASGHIGNFSDPLIENKVNNKRYRADKIIEEHDSKINAEAMSFKEMEAYINQNINKYDGSKTEWSSIRQFHLMFETHQGVLVDKKSSVFLRPETAQGIFVNFKNVQRSQRAKVPFGIAQVGKSFRNEVTPGNFIFRTREFEQMELEYFTKPGEDEKVYKEMIHESMDFIESLGINKSNLKLRVHHQDELAHYSKGTCDVEYNFPFGWGELMGIANRTDFDLKAHMNHSKESLEYLDPMTNEKYVPFVIEPSFGLDRLMLATLLDAYQEEKIGKETRLVLKLDAKVAPYKIAVLPLMKKLSENSKTIFKDLLETGISATHDVTGSIGKRYRRQDAIGTPFVITFDFDSLEDEKVTIRNRDTMKQERIAINKITEYINK